MNRSIVKRNRFWCVFLMLAVLPMLVSGCGEETDPTAASVPPGSNPSPTEPGNLAITPSIVPTVAPTPVPTTETTAPPPTPTDAPGPTPIPSPTPTTEPGFAIAPATGAEIRWHTWPELRETQGAGTGPWVTLPAADHTGLREFWLQVVCWPKRSARDLSDRTLAVIIAEVITDTDTIAAVKSAPLSEGYFMVDISIDGEGAGESGWLYETSEGSAQDYYYAEMLTANEETSEELIAELMSGDARELAATVLWHSVEDHRAFDVTGVKEVLAPVVDSCQE